MQKPFLPISVTRQTVEAMRLVMEHPSKLPIREGKFAATIELYRLAVALYEGCDLPTIQRKVWQE